MKNIMILTFMVLGSCFAFALANADSDSNTNPQAGAAEMAPQDSVNPQATSTPREMPGTMQSETKMSRTESTHRTCTDQNGVTHKKGQKGYKSCVEAMGKTHRSETNE